MTILVTYHTPDMSISAERCKQSALKNGCDRAIVWTRAALEQTEFYEQNKELLDQPRGSGYWAWKPYIILDALIRFPNDTIVYADAGVEFIAPVSYITNQMQDIWLFGNMYNHRDWCKRDVMDALNIYPDHNQCQASVIFVRNGARFFIEEWLGYCTIPALINDDPSVAPNYPGFSDHRHDQALLTCCAYYHGVNLNWWPAVYNNGAFIYPSDGYTKPYPPLFHHTRKRNHEW